jgi:hypothetical protein
MGEDDDLSHQADGYGLNAHDHEQNSQEQEGTVPDSIAHQADDGQVDINQKPGPKEGGADEAKEAEGLFGEFDQEKEGQVVKLAAYLRSLAVNARLAQLLLMSHLHLFDPKSLPMRQNGKKAKLVAIDGDLLHHLPAHDPQATVQIVHREVGQPPSDPVKGRGLEAIQERIDPRISPANDQIGAGVDLPEKLEQVPRAGLHKRSQGDDDITSGFLKSDGKGHCLSENSVELDDFYGGLPLLKALEKLIALAADTIIDKDELILPTGPVKLPRIAGVYLLQISEMSGDGDDH